MKTKLIFLFVLFSGIISAQTDWNKWEADNSIYQLPEIKDRDYSLDHSNFGTLALTMLRDVYWFGFSDLDGDNCPFQPTCSTFFVDAVKKTNIVQGVLMFADRFTRDSNFFKSESRYKIGKSGKLIDPVDNYMLDENKITILGVLPDETE